MSTLSQTRALKFTSCTSLLLGFLTDSSKGLQSAFNHVHMVLTWPVSVRPNMPDCFPDMPALMLVDLDPEKERHNRATYVT